MASWPWQQLHLASWALGFICCLTAWYVLREKTGWGWGMQKRSCSVRWYDIWYVIFDEFLVLSAGNTVNLWKEQVFFYFRLTYYIELKGTTSTFSQIVRTVFKQRFALLVLVPMGTAGIKSNISNFGAESYSKVHEGYSHKCCSDCSDYWLSERHTCMIYINSKGCFFLSY